MDGSGNEIEKDSAVLAGLVRLLTFTAAADILRWQTGAISGM